MEENYPIKLGWKDIIACLVTWSLVGYFDVVDPYIMFFACFVLIILIPLTWFNRAIDKWRT